jgi:predicted SnoaL-like aldol condensation-catalyzing enzyme
MGIENFPQNKPEEEKEIVEQESDPEYQKHTSESERVPENIASYFQELGRDKAKELISKFSSPELLKKAILEGNLGYVIHLMQTAEMGDDYHKMTLDMVDDDPKIREGGGEKFVSYIAKGYETASRHETGEAKESVDNILDLISSIFDGNT